MARMSDLNKNVKELTGILKQYKQKTNLQATQNQLLMQHVEQLKQTVLEARKFNPAPELYDKMLQTDLSMKNLEEQLSMNNQDEVTEQNPYESQHSMNLVDSDIKKQLRPSRNNAVINDSADLFDQYKYGTPPQNEYDIANIRGTTSNSSNTNDHNNVYITQQNAR